MFYWQKEPKVGLNNESLLHENWCCYINFATENKDESQPGESVGAGGRDAGKCGNEPEGKPLTLQVRSNAVPLTVAERPLPPMGGSNY